jgi:hypothetical protein
MTTNAPYYQLGGGQFTNPTNASYVPDHLVVGNYDLAASAPVTPPNDAQAATNTAKHLYREHLKRPQQIASPVASLEADTHYFVDLLEAATTAAAGQARMVESTLAHTDGTESMGVAKRKRLSSSPPAENAATADTASEPKRARVDHLTNTQLQAKESDASDRSASGSVPPSSESLLNDARAAGVHSAAALFRRSSEKTNRKYTRPPMSKLFLSLQLTPENFLHLQAHAKAYMLDPAHPDRQSCVGNRGKGDTDMVKLRLFNCVRDFLQHGVGEQYFGEQSEKPRETDTMEVARALGQEKMTNEDKLVWPRDANKIISLVTPLLRRMVTNERYVYSRQTDLRHSETWHTNFLCLDSACTPSRLEKEVPRGRKPHRRLMTSRACTIRISLDEISSHYAILSNLLVLFLSLPRKSKVSICTRLRLLHRSCLFLNPLVETPLRRPITHN